MKILLLLATLAMPMVAFFTQMGWFGPDSATVSNQYPTLLVAAGYAFAIWSVIFTLDLGFAIWQAMRRHRALPEQRELRIVTSVGFALTASWMIAFSAQMFWLALIIIWTALACILYGCLLMARAADPRGHMWLGLLSLGLHAGWLSLAAFLNTAQVAVAYQLLPAGDMLSWSLALWAAAALLVFWANAQLHGHPAYTLAVLWGLVGVYVEQSHSRLRGAEVSASVALSLALLLLAQTGWLLWRAHRAGERSLLPV
ncbi:hypothetical protein [Pelomonas sp. KK5]|uniref:hypothetical protein n=1 Tax=Pelomonas sp. KK5 TaxID=1855730 RepID=UPI00097C69D2|nr:hypothetical protein [Pelomonas sp. KK5]